MIETGTQWRDGKSIWQVVDATMQAETWYYHLQMVWGKRARETRTVDEGWFLGRKEVDDPKDLLQDVLLRPYFTPHQAKEIPIPVTYFPGHGKLVLVVGENASGKSFFRRVVMGVCQQRKVECMHISMQGRRQSHIFNSFIYGSEDYDSTGKNSARTVSTGIKTSHDRENSHVLFWDEPDLGMSDTWAASTGEAIANFGAEAPNHLVYAFVVTHNRAMIKQLVKAKPHVLIFDDGEVYGSLSSYLDREITTYPLSELDARCQRRFKLIQAVLNERKAEGG